MHVKWRPWNKFTFILLFFIFLLHSCTPSIYRQLRDPSVLKTPVVSTKKTKVHMKDGSLYLLDSLITRDNSDLIEGYGYLYDKYRDLVTTNIISAGLVNGNAFMIPLSQVALIETNSGTHLKGNALAVALVAIPTLIITGLCVTDPKACFGSCPTFYCWDGEDTTLMAEGFSSSILRVFEKEDIDMLYGAKATGNNFHIRLKNEALETHVIRYANLLAVPVEEGERVFSTEKGEFFKTSAIKKPSSCIAPEGDCLEKISDLDRLERFSTSDPDNLAKKELIELSFDNSAGSDLGLLIGCRQTLLTTYLFYQGLAYLGNSAGYLAAKIENGNKFLQKKVDRVWDKLGGIEILVQGSDGRWVKISEVEEMGPIATDVHLVKLPELYGKKVNIKLRLTKGLWRIDYLALCELGKKVEPEEIQPLVVTGENGTETNTDLLLRDPENPLVTLPGDEYDICYKMPDNTCKYELFLKSKGYYIEWMRDAWIMEENHRKAALLFGFPGLFMRRAAGDFKKKEASMENIFWTSKYVKKN